MLIGPRIRPASGLNAAEAMRQPDQIVAFCAHLGAIAARQEKFVDASKWFMRGLHVAGTAGNYELYLGDFIKS